jgi:hypothetical protein
MAYFHNIVGLLTETIGNPTPARIPFLPQRHLPDSNLHLPIEPQEWHFRQSIEYSLTANYAVFDIASRNRENFLFNIYQMGKNSIERGSRDSWSNTPSRVQAAQAALAGGRGGSPEDFKKLLRDPSMRDPRGFILPSDQPDFPTATKFINALLKTGIEVRRATAPFTAGGQSYPAGSYVVKTAQAFRPHVLDMFEPQDHPDDLAYPGGPPTRPYDNAGWTLAYQMGVKADRLLDAFDGPFEKVTGLQKPAPGRVTGTPGTGFLMSHAPNDAFTAINRLLAADEEVAWLLSGPRAGAFYITSRPSTAAVVNRLASELGLSFEAVAARPDGEIRPLRRIRVALADQYGGSMPSGWTRWLLEQFDFPFEVVYPKTLDAGSLSAKYDVIIFPSGVGAALGRDGTGGTEGAGAGAGAAGGAGGNAPSVPPEYEPMVGAYTASRTGPQVRKFVEDGGTVLAVGASAMSLAQLFHLPVTNHLVEKAPDGTRRPLPPEKYYIPGSVLRMAVDPAAPLAHGITSPVDVFFDNSPVFALNPDATMKGVRPVGWFDSATPLRSGWAYGQGYLEGGVQIVEASVGAGKVVLFGPQITFRAQPHGTFKFLFNAIYLAEKK